MAKNTKEKIEQIIIWVIAVLSAVVSILDLFGALDSIPWVAKKTPALILLVIAIIASYLVLERRNNLDKLMTQANNIETLVSEGIEHTIKSVGGVQVTIFTKDDELLEYLVDRIHYATESIDDLS